MRLILTSSSHFCRYSLIWPYFFCLSITRVMTSTFTCKGFL